MDKYRATIKQYGKVIADTKLTEDQFNKISKTVDEFKGAKPNEHKNPNDPIIAVLLDGKITNQSFIDKVASVHMYQILYWIKEGNYHGKINQSKLSLY